MSQGREVTARELLDQAARKIDNELAQQPEVRIRLLQAIGQAYHRQGHYARAITYLSRALHLRQQLAQNDKVSTVPILLQLAASQRENGQLSASDSSLRTASDVLSSNQHIEDPERARLLAAMGRLYLDRGDWQQSETTLGESAELMRTNRTIEPFELVTVVSELAAVQMWKGDFVAAEKTAREALQISRERLPPLHPTRIGTEFQLAELLASRGRNDEEAVGLLESVLKARRTLYGETSSDVADTLDVLARERERQGRSQEAEQLLRQALDIQKRSVGPEHFLVAYQHTSLGILLLKVHKPRAAEQEVRAALTIYAKSLPADHQYIAAAEHVLGEALIAQARFQDAEQILVASRDRWKRTAAPPWRAARSASALGEALYGQHRLEEAEQLLIEGYRGVTSDPAADIEARERARERLTRFYRDTGHPEKLRQVIQPAS
ncbi:MAG: tetratricopeptide repeat protein [Steroidobacteraceae bacterium]